jgi:hypothetical protein
VRKTPVAEAEAEAKAVASFGVVVESNVMTVVVNGVVENVQSHQLVLPF